MKRAPELPNGVVPTGATHFYHNPERNEPSTWPWRKRESNHWFMHKNREWSPINGNNQALFVPNSAALDRPVWDGVGEPPIGAQIEFRVNRSEWETVTVFAVKERDGEVDVLFDGAKGWGVVKLNDERLRNIPTLEQMEREKACHDMAFELFAGCDPKHLELAYRIYDLNYRKVKPA